MSLKFSKAAGIRSSPMAAQLRSVAEIDTTLANTACQIVVNLQGSDAAIINYCYGVFFANVRGRAAIQRPPA